MSERRFNPEKMAKLDSPERLASLPPQQQLDRLDVKDSVSVLDIGAGTGYFTLPAAERTTGTVYALDVEPRMLERIRERAIEKNLANVQTMEGRFEHLPLESETVDRVIASHVLHEAEPFEQALREIDRVLRKGGRCLCIDWEKKATEQGPPQDHRIHSDDMKAAFEQMGYRVLYFDYPTDSHYSLVVEKQTATG
jgi:ubiquinone/menaquinone biosynthesis C-methylase UbiE